MSLGKHFTPFWLHTIQTKYRNSVVDWLKMHDIDVERCESFHFDGQTATCHMYKLNEQGKPQITMAGEPIMDEDVVFTSTQAPSAVRSYL